MWRISLSASDLVRQSLTGKSSRGGTEGAVRRKMDGGGVAWRGVAKRGAVRRRAFR